MTSHPLLGETYQYHKDYGGFINAKHERIARIISEYDPELELGWIPPANRDGNDTQPYCIIHNHPNGTRQVISYWREDQVDERILEWIFENDFKKHSPNEVWDRMKASELAKALLAKKKIEDETLEEIEFANYLAKTPLHTVKHGGRKYR